MIVKVVDENIKNRNLWDLRLSSIQMILIWPRFDLFSTLSDAVNVVKRGHFTSLLDLIELQSKQSNTYSKPQKGLTNEIARILKLKS